MESSGFQHSLSKTIPEIDANSIEIISVIDRGSFGTVKIAVWKNRQVAVKIFETVSEIEAFRTEVEVLGSVAHRNIIELYGMSVGIQCYIVMELATQGSLYNLLHKRIDIAYTKDHMLVWWTEISEAISYLHNLKPKPIIHRDLKSSNILLKDEHIKICDFGTACDIHTLMSNAKGTVAWMAPEVITTTSYNEKCDVYSFGIVMWEILMRKIPFRGLNSFQIMQRVANKKRPQLPDSLPASIQTIIQLCWSHEPMSRPDFATLCQLLGRMWEATTSLQVEPPPAVPPAPATPDPPPGPSCVGNVAYPSPPRFPITPASCTPSPTVAQATSVANKNKPQSDTDIHPFQPISTIPESCDLYAEHAQAYEEYQALLIHFKRKKSTMKALQEKYKAKNDILLKQESSNEGRELRLSLLRSKNEALNQELNFALDHP